MKRWGKLGIVLAGYSLALVASVLVVAIYDRRFSPADNQAMGGMIAGGEMMYGAAIFVMLSLLPTGLALWFLRRSRRAWLLFSGACIAFAGAGLAAILMSFAAHGQAPDTAFLVLVELVALGQMLGSPLWIGAFALFARLAPATDLRRRVLFALAIEVVVAVCAAVHFLVPRPPI